MKLRDDKISVGNLKDGIVYEIGIDDENPTCVSVSFPAAKSGVTGFTIDPSSVDAICYALKRFNSHVVSENEVSVTGSVVKPNGVWFMVIVSFAVLCLTVQLTAGIASPLMLVYAISNMSHESFGSFLLISIALSAVSAVAMWLRQLCESSAGIK